MAAGTHGKGVIELPFLDFAPDLAYDATMMQKGVVLIDMDNAQPTVKGYQCLNSLEPYAEPGYTPSGMPAPEGVQGSTVAYFENDPNFVTGTPKVFFGGPNNLWRLDGSGWTGVGSVPGAWWRWRFTQFGNDLIAMNPGYTYSMVATGITGTFAPLGGNPPNNPTTGVAVNGQVLMFSGSNWYCSALDTDNDWTPDVQTQAGQGVLYDYPGPVVAAAPIFRNCIAFKETATWLGSYVGGYAVWSWQLISDLTGTWCQESVIVMPDCVAFVGADDFYVCSGYTPQRIPNNLKEWFFDIADPNYFTSILSRYDANHAVCYWYFVSRTQSAEAPSTPEIPETRASGGSFAPPIPGIPDRWIAWNSRTGRWAAGYVQVAGAVSVPTPNQQPGMLSGLIFQADQILKSWTGAPGIARYETGYFGSLNQLSQCMRARPVYYVAPDSATMQTYHVRVLGDGDISGPTTFLNRKDGWYYFRQYDQWHRLHLATVGPNITPSTVSQAGAEISAMAVELRQGGWR